MPNKIKTQTVLLISKQYVLNKMQCLDVSNVFDTVSKLHTRDIDTEHRHHAINAARLAEVWMDDYKRFFYTMRPEMKV